MTTIVERPLEAPEDPVTSGSATGAEPETEREQAPVSPAVTSLAVFFSAASAGWMAGGIFSGVLPRLVGVLGAAIGSGAVALSFRTRRPAVIQYLGIVGALAAGVLLVVPDAKGGSANLPGLVMEALRAGGVSTPPISFDPGWRFLLVVFTALLAGGSAALSISLARPKLGIILPLPLVFAVTLIQPGSTPPWVTAVGIVLIPAALTVSHGAELARDGSTSGRFELRRLGRSAAVLLAMMGGLVALGQLGLLLPQAPTTQVVPPQRPQLPPPQPDRPLFSVQAPRPLTWRVGDLDVYDGAGWLLPPYDPSLRAALTAKGGQLPPDVRGPVPPRTLTATVTLSDISGHVLPTLAGLTEVRDADAAIVYEPRSQTLRLPEQRAEAGLRYTVVAAVPPDGARLASARTVPAELTEFVQLPPAPPEVTALLAKAPKNLYDRLQYVRSTYYRRVVAAGPGKPIDVPPSRVVSLLGGKPGSPYEITAGEALLVRWAGIPARIGFGYYTTEHPSGKPDTYTFRPQDGATWLEAYFSGSGWVPFVGIPPKATASLSESQKHDSPNVIATGNLALSTYIPVRTYTAQQLYDVARYWLVRTLPVLVGLGLLLGFYPGAVKALRRVRRRRWGRRAGLQGQLLVAYAAYRDLAYDLNVGVSEATPLEFLGYVAHDDEHAELAWLVTRGVWGDLNRDLRQADLDAGLDLARSVSRRLRNAQTPTTRVLAFASRASLRSPWTNAIPNLWWPPRRKRGIDLRRHVRFLSPRRLMASRSTAVLLVVCSVFLQGCSSSTSLTLPPRPLPKVVVASVVSGVDFRREPVMEVAYRKAPSNALVDTGQVYTARRDGAVLGSLQIARFKPGLVHTKHDRDDLRNGVLAGLGRGDFTPTRVGSVIVLTQQLSEQNQAIWFSPDLSYFELFVTARSFESSVQVFADIIAAQQGKPRAASGDALEPDPDPRLGGVQ